MTDLLPQCNDAHITLPAVEVRSVARQAARARHLGGDAIGANAGCSEAAALGCVDSQECLNAPQHPDHTC